MSTASRARVASIAVLAMAMVGCSDDPPRTVPAASPASSVPESMTTLTTDSPPPTDAPATSSTTSTTTSSTTSSTTGSAGGVVSESLDPGPLSPRFSAATVAVGGLFLVYGGRTEETESLDDGAVYDTSTGGWSLLPSSGGLAAGAYAALATGGSVVFAGAFGVASFDLSTSRWTALPSPPSAECCLYASGSSLFAISEFSAVEPPQLSVSRFDPATAMWIELPRLQGMQLWNIVEVNGSLIAIVGHAPAVFQVGVSDPAGMSAMRLEGDTWVDLAMPPLDWFYGIFATTDGTEMFVWDGSFVNEGDDRTGDHGLVFSADSTWAEIPPLPRDWWECYISPVAMNGVLVVDTCGSVARYDIAEGAMKAIGALADPTPAPFVAIEAAAYRWGNVFCYACDGPLEIVFQRLTVND